MAKYQSDIFNVISGSENGKVFSRNRYSAYFRARTTPIYTETPARSNLYLNVAAIASGWRALTTDQRQLWNSYATNYNFSNGVNGTYKPSGYQLYFQENYNRLLLDLTLQYTPLPILGIGQIMEADGSVDLISVPGKLRIIYASDTPRASAGWISFTPPVPFTLNIGSIKNKFRQLRDTTSIPLPVNYGINDFQVPYDQMFGTNILGNVPPGGNIWAKITPVRADYTNASPIIFLISQ